MILGWTHAGAINTLDYIAEITGAGTFYTVLGGMHLLQASTDHIHVTIECLKRYDVQLIGANHCAGMKAVSTLSYEFGDRCVDCRVIARITCNGWRVACSWPPSLVLAHARLF